MKAPTECQTMGELRHEIDALDASLVALLSRRAQYIDQAIVLKPGEALPARIASRVEEVVAHVRDTAESQNLDPDLAEGLWRRIIDWSITREEQVLRPLEGPQNPHQDEEAV